MKKIILIYTSIILASLSGHAQGLSLQDCIKLAKQNNTEIKKYKLVVKEAHLGKKSAFAKFFPDVSAIGYGMKANTAILDANISGVNLSLIKEGFFGGLSLFQPIYLGGQISNANKLANEIIDLQEVKSEIVIDEVELLTEQYYWQYFKIKEKLRTIKAVEKLVVQTHKEVSASVKAGLITNNNELQVKLKLDEIKTSKIQLQNNANYVKMLLLQHIGMTTDSLEIMCTLNDTLTPPVVFSVDYKTALNRNKTYDLLNKNIHATKYQTKIEKGKLSPSIGFGANYLFENIVDDSHFAGIVSIQVSIPISSWWGSSYNIKQKITQEKIAELEKVDMGEKIMVQMYNSYNELNVNFQQIKIAKESVESAAENVRLNTDYYNSGMVLLSDLLNAQSILHKTKDNYIELYVEYQIKLSEYKKLIGD